MKLKTQLQVALLLVATLSIVLTGWQSFKYSRDALEAITFARLTAIRETKKQQIESYFSQIRNQIVTLAEDRMTTEAMHEFIRSRRSIRQMDPPETLRTSQGKTGSGSKASLPVVVIDYSQTRSRYDKAFRNFARRFGYDDILLADGESGDVVYSAAGNTDIGINLREGPFAHSNLAKSFAEAITSPANDSASLVDFAPYGTADSPPAAFVASPVLDGAERIGVLVFRLSIHDLNNVMTSETRWEEEGLGKTGETYIVGADYRMRNDSRFFVQDSSTYFKRIRRAGADSAMLAHIRDRSTSILIQEARTEATLDALKGNTDTRIIDDYRGIPVLSSYTPLSIPGVQWVILAEIDVHEALAPVALLRERLIFAGVVLLLLAAAVGFLVSRTISSPLIELTAATEEFGKGNLSLRASPSSHGEIGVLARTFNRMADSMEENTQRLHTEINERKRAEQELRASREELRSLSTHLQSIREEERQGIAREIHDELGQALSSLKLELALLREELFTAPGEAEKRMLSMSAVCDSTIKSVRRIITTLRPRLLDDLGLTAAIEWQAEEFQQRTGIPCALTITPEEITLDGERSTAIFRIFQETLTNIARHARATRVTVEFSMDKTGVRLLVRDNGIGVQEQQVHDSRSFGLLGMRERAHYWDGTVAIKGAPKQGTSVSVFLPGNFIGGEQ